MGGFAWVTLATNDSYSLGALVLANSLKQAGTRQELVVLVTPGVTNSMRDKLSSVFNVVKEVNILDSKDEANLRLLKRPELGVTFTKLHCWRLTQYDKCVFLDADTLVLQNCDELFEREELSAAPDVGWPDCFNSGVFVYRPSNETYEKLIQFALEKGSFDGGDQGLLNLYFSDWATKDISRHLPFIYNMCSTACYSYLPAFKQFGANAKIVHFIGAAKPWLQYFNTETQQVQPSGDASHLQNVLQHWWDIFCSLIHPNLTPDMARSCSSDVRRTNPSFQIPKSPERLSYFDHPTSSQSSLQKHEIWDPWENYRQESESVNLILIEPDIKPIESHNTNACCIASHDISTPFEHTNPPPSPSSDIQTQSDPYTHLAETISSTSLVIHSHDRESHGTDPIEPICRIESTPPPPSPPPVVVNIVPTPNAPTHPVLPTEASANDCTVTALHPKEDSNESDAGLAGAFAHLKLGAPRTEEQNALEDHLRRQGWEVGNIDYLGRDSFENIWSKICETISGALPQEEAKLDKETPTTLETEVAKATETTAVKALQETTPQPETPTITPPSPELILPTSTTLDPVETTPIPKTPHPQAQPPQILAETPEKTPDVLLPTAPKTAAPLVTKEASEITPEVIQSAPATISLTKEIAEVSQTSVEATSTPQSPLVTKVTPELSSEVVALSSPSTKTLEDPLVTIETPAITPDVILTSSLVQETPQCPLITKETPEISQEVILTSTPSTEGPLVTETPNITTEILPSTPVTATPQCPLVTESPKITSEVLPPAPETPAATPETKPQESNAELKHTPAASKETPKVETAPAAEAPKVETPAAPAVTQPDPLVPEIAAQSIPSAPQTKEAETPKTPAPVATPEVAPVLPATTSPVVEVPPTTPAPVEAPKPQSAQKAAPVVAPQTAPTAPKTPEAAPVSLKTVLESPVSAPAVIQADPEVAKVVTATPAAVLPQSPVAECALPKATATPVVTPAAPAVAPPTTPSAVPQSPVAECPLAKPASPKKEAATPKQESPKKEVSAQAPKKEAPAKKQSPPKSSTPPAESLKKDVTSTVVKQESPNKEAPAESAKKEVAPPVAKQESPKKEVAKQESPKKEAPATPPAEAKQDSPPLTPPAQAEQASGATPTPPPRKSSGGGKKQGKPKK